jgi:hypothetical protein
MSRVSDKQLMALVRRHKLAADVALDRKQFDTAGDCAVTAALLLELAGYRAAAEATAGRLAMIERDALAT